MPELSIIVPVYNVEQYLKKCINSILAQTFTDFELILVDDGSPDNCGAICDEYAAKDSRVRVIHKENGGLSSARNAGMAIAAGSYYLFCDSDDYVAPTWCEHFMAHVKPEHDNFIFGGFVTARIRENETALDDQNTIASKQRYPVSDFFKLQGKAQIGYACNVLYYADVLKQHGIRFSKDIIVEDLPFNLAYLKYMRELSGTGAAEYYYVQDERETLSRKYYPNAFQRWREKYEVSMRFIGECLPEACRQENVQLVANSYLYPFLHALNNTFDSRNTQNFARKIAYNAAVVRSETFQHCLRHADTSKENSAYIAALKKKSYHLAYLIQLSAQIKNKLRRK